MYRRLLGSLQLRSRRLLFSLKRCFRRLTMQSYNTQKPRFTSFDDLKIHDLATPPINTGDAEGQFFLQ